MRQAVIEEGLSSDTSLLSSPCPCEHIDGPGSQVGRVRVRQGPEGHRDPGDRGCCFTAPSARSLLLWERAAAQFWLKGYETRFHGGWLRISNQHIITMSASRVTS